uniref:Uncharacterized protein n=1 Tax=Oryza punctata TaxID=4537 RepID=A0A0E0KKD6_ORYPU
MVRPNAAASTAAATARAASELRCRRPTPASPVAAAAAVPALPATNIAHSEKVAEMEQAEGRSMARVTLMRNPSAGSSRSLTSTHRHFLLPATTCPSPAQQSLVGALAVAFSSTYVRHVASAISLSAHSALSAAKSPFAGAAATTIAAAATTTHHLAAAIARAS